SAKMGTPTLAGYCSRRPPESHLFLRYPHRHPAILGPSIFGRVVRHRVLLPVTFGHEAARRNSLAREVGHHGLCTIARESQVLLGSPHIVGVSADLHVDVWVGLENCSYIGELLLRFRLEVGRRRVEDHSVEIEPRGRSGGGAGRILNETEQAA